MSRLKNRVPSALEAAYRCQQSRGFRAGHSFRRRRSLFARGQTRRCLLSRRYSIYKRYRRRERTPGKRRVLPFGCEILPEVKEVKLPYPYFTGFRACARQPSSRLWITSPYGTLLRGIHRTRGRSHTACLLTERINHAFMSLYEAPRRAALRPNHHGPSRSGFNTFTLLSCLHETVHVPSYMQTHQ